MAVHVFGIRHHGPGCARSLLAGLEQLQPDAVVLEGPADAEEILHLAGRDEMRPPVAMLLYPPNDPRRAVYYPLAEFSPEWQTLRWALTHRVPIHLMDLPQSLQMAATSERVACESTPDERPEGDRENPSDSECASEDTTSERQWRADPLALLAEAAGYRDHELWWEQQIERRRDATGIFDAILEAMRTVRSEFDETTPRDLLREAFMRRTIRAVLKQGHERVAVVCGAWHGPVLDDDAVHGKREGCRAKDDNERLKGLAKIKTVATWVPWTYSRLTYGSGYGAGVHSPGWYSHLWQARDQAPLRWISTAARLLRAKDLDASSASVIEAVRLADALAAMRELQSPGLTELNESILTVLCHGESAPLRLIRNRLEIGDVLGSVPSDTPTVPLARDVAAFQKRLRFPPSTEVRNVDLDLRKDIDLARSHLLHRLRILNIGWGELRQSGGRASTFHEIWQVRWQPEFAVAIIEANVWGNTVEAAATARLIQESAQSGELVQITSLLDAAILGGLTDAIDPLLARIQAQAAVAEDVRHLMDAMMPLARVARYGDVRRTRAEQVVPIVVGMFERVLVGLPAACAALDDEAAERMLGSIGGMQQSLDLLNRPELQSEWQACLRRLLESRIHALLRGWCCRLLLEKRELADEQLYRFARLALSTANPPKECADWATGLLRGSGLLLLHQDELWEVLDRWISELPESMFIEMLPLLRRAFADFAPAERRKMGEKAKHLRSRDKTTALSKRDPQYESIDVQRARLAIPILAQILGVPNDSIE